MIKDLLKSMNDVYADSNINLYEKSILLYLIKQFNSKDGYAYPKYESISQACGIKRRANISDAIKSLVIKGYITVKKVAGNKSHYYIEKYLHFVGEKVKSNEKEISAQSIIEEMKNSTNVENIEDSENKVNFKNNSNSSKIAKAYEGKNKFKLTPFYCEAFSHIDGTVLDMVLKNEKAKTATLLLKKCIRISKQIGLELSREFVNKVMKFESYKEEWELTLADNEVYKAYMDFKML